MKSHVKSVKSSGKKRFSLEIQKMDKLIDCLTYFSIENFDSDQRLNWFCSANF